MTKIDKLLAKVRNNPKDVRFTDACKIAVALGFTAAGGKGSHTAYARPNEAFGLNFQKKDDGKIPTYQAKQLIEMMDKYGDGL